MAINGYVLNWKIKKEKNEDEQDTRVKKNNKNNKKPLKATCKLTRSTSNDFQ